MTLVAFTLSPNVAFIILLETAPMMYVLWVDKLLFLNLF